MGGQSKLVHVMNETYLGATHVGNERASDQVISISGWSSRMMMSRRRWVKCCMRNDEFPERRSA